MTNQEIQTFISEPKFQKIINEQEFYFAHGKNALDKWLELDVSVQIKDDIIRLSNDYTQFIEASMINPEVEKIKNLLLEIVSYCDNNARDKTIYNRYEDNRVLAKASVRMGNWISALIIMKFNLGDIKGSSILNAFNYLEDPENNTTILSDNHRRMVSENLLHKKYDVKTFTTDLKHFFSQFQLTVKNHINYTYLISSIIYQLKNNWIEEVVGLMASDGTGWQEDLLNLEHSFDGIILWNSKKPTRGNKTLKFLSSLIKDGHTFPLYYSQGGKVEYKATIVDFAVDSSSYKDKNWHKQKIKNYLPSFEDYKDDNKKASIVFVAESMEQIQPIPVSEFGFYDRTQKPRQDNLSPLKEIPEDLLEQDKKVIKNIMNCEKNKTALNQILFGPPGTGKTHYLLKEIIPSFITNTYSKSDESIEAELISNLPWWKVFTLILMEEENLSVPQIKEHKYTKYKLEVSNTKSLNQTVWGQLSSHTVNDSKTVEYSSRSKVLIFNKNDDSTWFISKKNNAVIDELNELKSELDDYKNNKSKSRGNYKFITFHQSTSYETFVEGITPVFDENLGDDNGEVKYEIKKGAFYQACEEASKLAGFIGLKDCLEASKQERIEKFKNAPDFGLFIDEINRGNVSSILGELITLIEEDKRLSRNEIILELPYSQRKFGVPPNLHIIGTMNTADRSVEALDTALRRRFSFKEMLPKYNIDEDKATLMYTYAGFKGAEILETINLRIEQLLDRDHLIGHSYFLLDKDQSDELESKLMDSFYRNIIPLLQEYFYGDYAKIGAVLGSGFVIKNENDSVTFGDGFNDEDYGDKDIYQIIDYSIKENPLILESMSFEDAIRKLMNKPKEIKAETQG